MKETARPGQGARDKRLTTKQFGLDGYKSFPLSENATGAGNRILHDGGFDEMFLGVDIVFRDEFELILDAGRGGEYES